MVTSKGQRSGLHSSSISWVAASEKYLHEGRERNKIRVLLFFFFFIILLYTHGDNTTNIHMIAHKNTLPSTLLEKCLICNPKTQQVQLEPTNFYIFSFRPVRVVPNKMASHCTWTDETSQPSKELKVWFKDGQPERVHQVWRLTTSKEYLKPAMKQSLGQNYLRLD